MATDDDTLKALMAGIAPGGLALGHLTTPNPQTPQQQLEAWRKETKRGRGQGARPARQLVGLDSRLTEIRSMAESDQNPMRPARRLIAMPESKQKIGLSKTTIYAQAKARKFLQLC